MDDEELRASRARARVFKALAHPSRMYIVTRLHRQPANVGDLAAAVGSDISTISKHLAVLKSAGIVKDTVRGRSVYYELYCPCIPEFLRCVDEVILHNQCPLPGRGSRPGSGPPGAP